MLVPLVDIALEDCLSGTTRGCGLDTDGASWCDFAVVGAGSVFRVEGSVFVAENDLTVSGGEVVEFGGAASFDLHASNGGGDVGVGDGGECGVEGDCVVSGGCGEADGNSDLDSVGDFCWHQLRHPVPERRSKLEMASTMVWPIDALSAVGATETLIVTFPPPPFMLPPALPRSALLVEKASMIRP